MRHCRFCGHTGHNIRTCPSRPSASKDADKQWFKKRRKSTRRCSFCFETGHDRRKCVKLHEEREAWVSNNAQFRARFLADMKKNGYGIGAVIRRKSYDGNDYAFVKAINWEDINFEERYSYAAIICPLTNIDTSHAANLPRKFGKTQEELLSSHYLRNDENDFLVETPTTPETINPPLGWLSGRVDKFPNRLH